MRAESCLRVHLRSYAVEESARGSAMPQKLEGCFSKRNRAGAVSQSAYTELLVVSSMH